MSSRIIEEHPSQAEIRKAVDDLRNSGPHKMEDYHMKAKVWVRDDEFGEDFQADIAVGDLIVALKNSALPSVTRVPDGEGRVTLPDTGVWLCVRVGHE